MVLTRALAPLLLLPLAACMGPPEASCPADWHGAGLADGAWGLAEGRYPERAAACTAAGAPPGPEAEAAFQAGFAEGRAAFCAPRSALERGRHARPYGKVCEGRHLDLYRAGLDEYWLVQELRDVSTPDDHGSPFGGFGVDVGLVAAVKSRLDWLHAQNEAKLRAAEAEAAEAARAAPLSPAAAAPAAR